MINAIVVVVVVVEGGSRGRLHKAPVCANAVLPLTSSSPGTDKRWYLIAHSSF